MKSFVFVRRFRQYHFDLSNCLKSTLYANEKLVKQKYDTPIRYSHLMSIGPLKGTTDSMLPMVSW